MHRSVPIALAIVGLLALPAAVAASPPHLVAAVDPGRAIHISGTGFPASAPLTLTITRNEAAAGTRTLQSDVTGAFSATIPAGPGLGGHYRFVATSGSVKATADVVAVETAEGGVLSTVAPSAPSTNTDVAGAGTRSGSAWWLLALVPAASAIATAALVGRRMRRMG